MILPRVFTELPQLCLKRSNSLLPCTRTQNFGRRAFMTSSPRVARGKWPGKKPKLEPVENTLEGVVIDTGDLYARHLIKPFFFTVAFSSASMVSAAIWQYENIRAKAVSVLNRTIQWHQGWVQSRKHGRWRNDLNKWWYSLTDGQRLFIPICAANALVFLAWRVPAFQPTMVRYFCSNPASSAVCWPMVLSTFSHYSGFHLFANMYVLHSFSSGAVMNLGKEQFLGFYMATGVIASFASFLHKVVVNRPGLSLGASGAIMGVLAYTCTQYPDLELSIIFFPFFTFKAAAAIKVIMGIDMAGILLGWKYFDHAAHLGGALVGVFWSYWGSRYIWQNRDPILEVWHRIRGPTK